MRRRPEHLSCVNTREGIMRINAMQELKDKPSQTRRLHHFWKRRVNKMKIGDRVRIKQSGVTGELYCMHDMYYVYGYKIDSLDELELILEEKSVILNPDFIEEYDKLLQDKDGNVWEVIAFITDPSVEMENIKTGQREIHVIGCLNYHSMGLRKLVKEEL